MNPTRTILLSLLAAALACGGGTPTPTPSPAATTTPTPTDPSGGTPTAPPTPTPPPPTPADIRWPGQALDIPEDTAPLFDLTGMPTFRFRVSEAEWNGLLHDFDTNYRNEVYRQADVEVELPGEAPQTLGKVGLRLRGNLFSRVRPEDGEPGTLHDPENPLVRAHLRVKFNERFEKDEGMYGAPSQDLDPVPENKGRALLPGIEALNFKVNFNDPSYVREVASYDLFRRAGVPAPLAAYARLSLTIGEEAERYLGVFVMVEAVDEEFLRRTYADVGYLWKCLYQDQGPADLSRTDGDGRADAGRIGIERTDPADNDGNGAYRPSYDLKTHDDDFLSAEAGLNAFISVLGQSPNEVGLGTYLDVEGFLRAYAVSVFLGMSDDYWRNGNNYYLHQDAADGRFRFIPYDYDRTFGVETVGAPEATSSLVDWGQSRNVKTTVLMDRVLAVPALDARWRTLLAALHEPEAELFDADALATRMAELQALVEPHTGGYQAVDEFPYSDDRGDIEAFIQSRLDVAGIEVP